MKNVKLVNMNTFEERECYIFTSIRWRYRTIYAEAKIDGVKYEGDILLRKGQVLNLLDYSKEADIIGNDHTIVEYDIRLLNYESQQSDYQVVIYADLGQEDPANPKPDNIYLIENEWELKRYIDDLIDEEKNPWWDREDS